MAELAPTGTSDKGTDAAAILPRPSINTSEKVLRVVVPLASLLLALLAWHLFVTINEVPRYIIPSPADVWQAFFTDSGTLWPALLVTARITLLALALALIGGWALAILIAASRWFELAVFPFAVILQVTPMIAIAPLLLIYAPNTQTALLICAFIVAFFPILANVVQGLKSVDHNLLNLFELYGAKPWQTLFLLKVPAASPYFMTGLRIGGGLALIAAVVAEFAAGSAGQGAGLAFRLIEAQYRLNLPRLFVALVMLCGLGITIYAITSFISWLVLHRWHESAMRREN